jgi:outer membrane protein
MRISRSVIAAFFTIFLSSAPVWPQAPSPTTLTLPEAEAIALKNHPQIRASEARYLRSEQVIRENQSAYYPALNADVTGSQAVPGSRIGAGYLTASRVFSRLGYGITVSQLITDSGRTPSLVAQSKLQAEASRNDYQAAKDDVILAVHQAYCGVLLSQSLVDVAQQTVKARQTATDQIAELTKNKLKSQVDLSFAQANLSDARLMLLRAQNNLDGAFATLNDALGTQKADRYQLSVEPLPSPPPSGAEPLVSDAFAHRPELASLHASEKAEEKFAQAERDLKRPTVSLTAVAGFLPLIDPATANSNIPSEYEGAAVNVQIPIFNGHLFSARAKAAAYQVQEANQRIQDLQNRIARDVRTAWGRAQTAYEAIATSQQLLVEANSALDLAQGRYNLGLSSIVELTQAQLLQTQAQVGILNAQFEYQQAYAALQYEQGLLH